MVLCSLDQLRTVRRAIQVYVPKVEKKQTVGSSAAYYLGKYGQSRLFISCHGDACSPRLQCLFHKPATPLVATDQQRLHSHQLNARRCLRGTLELRNPKMSRKIKDTSFPQGSLNPYSSPHKFDELLRNGQTQAGTTE